jgi:alkylated DNA nucleotide flippase Atl1
MSEAGDRYRDTVRDIRPRHWVSYSDVGERVTGKRGLGRAVSQVSKVDDDEDTRWWRVFKADGSLPLPFHATATHTEEQWWDIYVRKWKEEDLVELDAEGKPVRANPSAYGWGTVGPG